MSELSSKDLAEILEVFEILRTADGGMPPDLDDVLLAYQEFSHEIEVEKLCLGGLATVSTLPIRNVNHGT